MSTEEFFKQYPKATKVHTVGEEMFTDAHYGEAQLHAKKVGKKVVTTKNPEPEADKTKVESPILLAENVTDETTEDEAVTDDTEPAPKKRAKKK